MASGHFRPSLVILIANLIGEAGGESCSVS